MGQISYNRLFSMQFEQGLSAGEFLKAVNISAPTYSKLKTGKPINSNIILKICQYFNCQPGEFMEYVDDDGNSPTLTNMQVSAIPQSPQAVPKPPRRKPGPKPDPNKKKKLTKAEEYEQKWKTDKYGISYFDMPGVGWVPAERTSNGFNGLDLDEVAKIKADYEKNEWLLVNKVRPEDYESLRIDGFLPVPDECLLPPDDDHEWEIIPMPGDFFGRRSWLCDDGKTYAIDIPIKRF